MKLKDFNDLIVFDEFPLRYNPHQKLVLTHLLHLEKQPLPGQLPTIITSQHIAKRFKDYCKYKGNNLLLKTNFIYAEPYKYIDIVLSGRRTLQLLFCESQERTRNLMVLIREDGKLKSIYAGNFLDIRSAVLNDAFIAWIERDSVAQLYLNLKRSAESPQLHDVDPIYKVFQVIKEILQCHSQSVLHLYLPQFGYETFVYKLANNFTKRIWLSSEYSCMLEIDEDLLNILCDCSDKARIVLYPAKANISPIDIRDIMKSKQLTVYLQSSYKNNEEIIVTAFRTYYSLYYSPEPLPFDLEFTCLLLKPKRIYGIIDSYNITSRVPSYLAHLCDATSPQDRSKRKSHINESLKSQIAKTITYGPQTAANNDGAGLYLDDSDTD